MTDNYGSKKGFNTNSGNLYIHQGKTNTSTTKPQMPNFHEWNPRYINEENMSKTLEYMRSGKHEKQTGVKHLKLSNEIALNGGTINNPDLNNI